MLFQWHCFQEEAEAREMTNRDRYIIKRNEYDLMCAVEKNTGICPIRAVAGISREEKIMRCYRYAKESCEACIQNWLNEEENKSYDDRR